jgi:hypothetical protein
VVVCSTKVSTLTRGKPKTTRLMTSSTDTKDISNAQRTHLLYETESLNFRSIVTLLLLKLHGGEGGISRIFLWLSKWSINFFLELCKGDTGNLYPSRRAISSAFSRKYGHFLLPSWHILRVFYC